MPSDLRQLFPALAEQVQGQPLVWLDNAATTQKPRAVIDAIDHYYCHSNANVHRASHTLSARATQAFEQAREDVRRFINARHSSEVIWTRGATEAVNLLAQSWGRRNLKAGDQILLSQMEHHANIVPWQLLAEELDLCIRTIKVTATGELDLEHFHQSLSPKVKVLSITHVSNALGTINPVAEMIAAARAHGITTIIDGAQAIGHFPVDVQALDCDFYLFSGHKMYGPTGIGVLYGRQALLEAMPPWQGGGEMIERVSFSGTTFQPPPLRFEPGTPNIAGVIGLAAAIHFLESLDRKAMADHETRLRLRLEQGLDQLPGVRRLGTSSHRTAVVSFVCDTLHNQDVGILLDQQGIAVRTGHHCAMPLMEALAVSGTVRASLACYNTTSDIDALINALHHLLHDTDATDHSSNTSLSQNAGGLAAGVALHIGFEQQPHFVPSTSQQLLDQLIAKRNWQDRYRQIMQLASRLPQLPPALQVNQAALPGCESRVWIYHTLQHDTGTLHFAIDSDARIIRGLLFILLSMLNGRTPADIVSFDVDALFTELGLINHLSPSRGNGLKAIVENIQATAKQHL